MSTWVVVSVVVIALLVVRRLLIGKERPEMVQEKLKAGATVVDVRTPGEFARAAFPGAVNIPLDALSSRMHEIPKDRPVVVYCASGMRSASAARVLRGAGYADVVNAGGLHDVAKHA